ncbi:hypothetical protein [Curtobacterium sp. UCD-KPL2560]|uniref:hypothetical protein n=1 Tax=Curtobacterium sp. UCD-KPL2560 TaxID=1885315 RepID=UPI00114CDCA2|nr:hypothetical protein [Curtobacterium sp. UCD-KPL2560]
MPTLHRFVGAGTGVLQVSASLDGDPAARQDEPVPAALEHHEISTSYRPPRVAVLTYAGSSWQAWAREALSAVSAIWGGEGFVLIPYGREGEIDPGLLAQLRHYDPDYLAVYAPGELIWSALSPEALSDRLSNDGDVADCDSMAPAAAAIAAATAGAECELLRGFTDGLPIPQYLRLRAVGERLPPQLLAATALTSPVAAQVARTHWKSSAALFAAFITGKPPIGPAEDSEPAAPPSDLIRWIASRDSSHAPDALTWFANMVLSSRSSDLQPWFDAIDDGLTWWGNETQPATVTASVGDTADDFALAVLLDRLHGQAVWITTPMLEQPAESTALAAGLAGRMATDPFERPAYLASASMSADELEAAVRVLGSLVRDAGLEDAEERLRGSDLPIRAPQRRLLVAAHADRRTTFPFLIERDGTAVLAHEPTLPLPSTASPLLADAERPGWLVDAAIDHPQSPRGRGTVPGSLQADGRATWVNLRDAKDGITFDAAFTGYLPPETPLEQRMARPRLQFLGLMPWVQQTAIRGNMRATLSRPGQLADLVADRLGGRGAFRQLVVSSRGRMLRAFQAEEPSEGGRVRLRRDAAYESFLTFDALLAQGSTPDAAALRDDLDELLRSSLLTRGFMLNCGECRTVQFTPIERVGRTYPCTRCGALNSLTGDRWHRAGSEPEFYYDLHPAMRTILKDSGDLTLLLGNRLARLAEEYSDLAEVEFAEEGAGKPSFEIDLIAHRDGDLVIGECKEGDLGGGQTRQQLIAKRLDAAELLRADRIVFGTALPEWPTGDQDAVRTLASSRGIKAQIDFIADLRRH